MDIFEHGIGLERKGSISDAKAIIALRKKYNELHKKLKHGRIAAWVIVSYFALGTANELRLYGLDPYVIGTNLVLLAIFIACAYLSIKFPYKGLLASTIFFLLVIVAMGIIEPISLIKGLLIKILVIIYLVKGITSCKEYFKTLRGLLNHGIDVPGSNLIEYT